MSGLERKGTMKTTMWKRLRDGPSAATGRSGRWVTVTAMAMAWAFGFGVALGPGVGGAAPPAGGEGRATRAESKAFMRSKLTWTGGVLEGLTLEQYDLIARDAIRLRDMTQHNLWQFIRQPDYLQQTTNFHRAADALFHAAGDKNLPAVTEAYVRLTRSCVDCHQILRLEQHRVTPSVPPQARQPKAGAAR